MLCSEWVPSEWEFQQLIKKITIIHTTTVHQLVSCEKLLYLFVINKSIKTFFYFQTIAKICVLHIAFSSEKVFVSESEEKYVQVKNRYKLTSTS